MAVNVPEAGELNTPCKFYEVTVNPLDFDPKNDTISATFKFSSWCKFEPVGAQLFFETAQLEDAVTHRAWVRYIPSKTNVSAITKQHLMLLIDEVFYKIKRATPVGKKEFTMIELTAQYDSRAMLND